MKIWNSKYALTEGLIEQEGEEYGEVGSSIVRVGSLPRQEYLHGEGKQWHRTRESALARAEVMRKVKIASVRRQLARLEALRFDA
ncbi:MAG: hypothetical protein ACK52I_13715 [Pseudomonadota bacterium]|jgi:hypothetical protein